MTSTPRIARVQIKWSENRAVPERVFSSLAEADAALATSFASEPPDETGGYDKTGFEVVWTDGWRHEGRAEVTAKNVLTAPAAGGILRQHLLRLGRWLIKTSEAPGWETPQVRGKRKRWGVELLRRVEAEPPLGAVRNLNRVPDDQLLPIGSRGENIGLTLLPDPLAAVAELEATFAADRPPVAVWMGHGRTVPRTTNRDVRYAANWLSLALAADMPRLRALTGRPHGALWDRWRTAIDHVRRHVGTEPEDTYRDSVRFWSDQVPRLAREVVDALGDDDAPRNSGPPERVQWRIRYRGPHGDHVTHQLAPDYSSALQAAASSLGFWPPVLAVHRLDGDRWRSA